MPNPNAESTLLVSNDHSIMLTSHRVIQRTTSLNKEIMLADFVGYELIGERSKYYRNLMLCFLGIAVLLGLWAFRTYQNAGNEAYITARTFLDGGAYLDDLSEDIQISTTLFRLFTGLFIISVFVFAFSKSRLLRISGKYSYIDVPLKHLKTSSYNRFINALIMESEKCKLETR
ncbi:hypothetical protein [Terrimonas ferruginea]|uniref:hypothetical protein n=1 Tax=Terrimonas ferruginea TaxID=249 RepID=UPI00092AAC4E|nr:hypothetical protein [Terrimonas ferruginea]OJW41643.1 MAG: hypothetical protein BGO56_17445 [Sphingobacteriales bacterium 48-107]